MPAHRLYWGGANLCVSILLAAIRGIKQAKLKLEHLEELCAEATGCSCTTADGPHDELGQDGDQ